MPTPKLRRIIPDPEAENRPVAEARAFEAVLERFQAEMGSRFYNKAFHDKRVGWADEDNAPEIAQCAIRKLAKPFGDRLGPIDDFDLDEFDFDALSEKDIIDVANFAAFLWNLKHDERRKDRQS